MLSSKTMAQGYEIIHKGFVPSFMCVVVSGKLHYSGPESSISTLMENDWLCEHSMWVSNWTCRGRCVATIDCDVIYVDEKAFHKRIQETEAIWALVCSYA